MEDAGLTYEAWRRNLPSLVTTCCKEWGLRLGEAYAPGAAGYAVHAELPDGTAVVLKLIYPHRESEHEADALRVWKGEGAVRLLAHDSERWAMLLERCKPGTFLSELEQDEALDVMIGLFPRLWKPVGAPFRPLVEEAAWWASSLPEHFERAGRPFERELLDAALEALRDLPASRDEHVLVHQDLHADNVLRAEREPWLAIDPIPLAGEREFGIAALVRGGELGFSERDVAHRLDRLSAGLGLDRDRARRWALAQTLAWAFEDGGVLDDHVECCRWLLQAAR